MWTRAELKERAKAVLKLNYWKALVVSLVILIAGGSGNGGGSGGGGGSRYYGRNNVTMSKELMLIIGAILLIVAIIVVVFIAFRIFAGYMLEVGGRKFFVRAAEGETQMGYLCYCFKEGRYFSVLVTMLLRSIYTFLWTLLFIIPGIIKYYSYRMVPYILADNPSIGHKRAIELSMEMTNGQKMDMFVLDLSFIGWYFLGALALGIGVIFVQPYYEATYAELYLKLRKDALERNMASYNELNILNA